MERTAYVLAVDLRKKMIKSIAEFGAKNTIGLGQAYVASSLSKYLKIAPGNRIYFAAATPTFKDPLLGIFAMEYQEHSNVYSF